MLVIDHARRLIQNFPSALPCEEAKVGVFQIKRLEQFVEPAQLEKFSAIESARSPASVEAREQFADLRLRAMPYAKRPLLPPSFR